ncbi:hypothetical protein Zmor_007507 [Zophobas morio]|uniref:Uncharacterized protein n=1 Tax=Zophobas morio TaxID=2755281 RepID=A0AA38MPM8_9CUCU|nr:hypothetical protein Zmor_007507 [Zophobas morio]
MFLTSCCWEVKFWKTTRNKYPVVLVIGGRTIFKTLKFRFKVFKRNRHCPGSSGNRPACLAYSSKYYNFKYLL